MAETDALPSSRQIGEGAPVRLACCPADFCLPRLPGGITDNEAGVVHLIDGPQWREAANVLLANAEIPLDEIVVLPNAAQSH